MPKQSYFEGWGFSDRIPVTISATPRKIEILKLELAKSFPDNQVDELDSRNIRFYAREEQLKKLKKFVSILNGKVYYENGGKLDSKKLVYVLYEPTPIAIKILNENGRTYLNWWQSNLNRGESERLLEKLQTQKLILGGLRYTGDTSDLKFEQGGNIGEALASSNPYIGGAKVIQGIAPESVSALDKKMARKINPDPNRPIFFDNGGSVGQNDYSVARIILQQLGGQGQLVLMTGANNFIAFSNGVSFKLKSRKANYVKITLNGNDLYDIQFQKLFGMKSKVVAEYSDIYFDQLIPIVEKETGMYLKMFKKGGMVSTQNRDMVISQLKAIHHHEGEMLDTLKNSGEVEAWVLAKISNASNDLSNVAHYLEFKE